MAEIEDLLEDACNGLEDLVQAVTNFKVPGNTPVTMPTPIVNIKAPPIPPAPSVKLTPNIVVQHDKQPVRIRVTERDRSGKVLEMEVTPI